MHPFGRRTDTGTGARRQRSGEDMRGGKHLGGADLDHRRSVHRVVGKRVDRSRKTLFARYHDAYCVGVIVRVGDHCARCSNAGKQILFLIEATENNCITPVAQIASEFDVFLMLVAGRKRA